MIPGLHAEEVGIAALADEAGLGDDGELLVAGPDGSLERLHAADISVRFGGISRKAEGKTGG